MAEPTTAADLQQYLCGVNWMRTAIPGYARLADPLLQLLRKCQDKAGSLTKLKLRAVRLRPYWNPELKQAFAALKEAVLARVTLVHPDATKVTCLYTDASTEFYAAVCSQVPREDLCKPVDEQRHEPLAFISGRFVKASLNWSVSEKEAFAVLVSMERLKCLTLPKEVQIYTDHKSLLSLYNPRAAQPQVPAHVASKLQRWGIKLSAFCYRIWHVDGESNFRADLMTRWARGKVLRAAMVPPPTTPYPEELLATWLDDLREQQSLLSSADSASFSLRAGLLWAQTPPGLYVPASKQLRLRLLIVAHCGTAGHRSFKDTLAKLQFDNGAGYSWPAMLDDVRDFTNGCLHCQASDGPYRIPRPWAEALHATRPNAILHMDWLYIGVSVSGHVYILVLKDDLSSYVWLKPFVHADRASTVKLLSAWMAAFGICQIWISDQGSHFMNNVMRDLAANLRVRHQFTTAYCPWSNGTVEVVNRAILRHLRKLTSELSLAQGQWPSLVAIVQFMLNQSPSPKLGGRTPLRVFTGHGHCTDQALRLLPPPAITRLSEQSLATLRATFIDSLRHLDAMHKASAETATRKRQARIRSHNAKTNVAEANFDVGDFVLVGTLRSKLPKLSVKWTGPCRIVALVNHQVFEIESLIPPNKRRTVHATRLKFSADKDLEVTEELTTYLGYQTAAFHVVDSLQGVRTHKRTVQVQVEWLGLEEEDRTWEPLENLVEDVPGMVEDYLPTVKRDYPGFYEAFQKALRKP